MDKPTDPLGYDVYAQTLWTRIQAALNKDQGVKPLGDDPLVVGIFGEWGVGKSYLLASVQKLADQELERQRKLRLTDEGFSLTVPVFFQPWKYEHEDHLHVPFVMHVFEALKEAIKRTQTTNEHWLQWLEAKWDKLLPHLPASVNLFEKLLLDSLAAGTGSSQMKWGLKAVSWLSKRSPIKSPQRSNLADRYKFSGDGHYYRHIQEALKAVTRPSQHPDLLQGFRLLCNPKINFVVFIDDLDRCLPEKAVQTLELIKTVFNVESFAFVLALDDEVIERGIGHRYKEYKLQDKKPEMPITGFEYLEKIVHLPFRLPELTREQATELIRIKELELQPAPDSSMSPIEQETQDKRLFFIKKTSGAVGTTGIGTTAINAPINTEITSDHFKLLIESFDHYVPRKLIRSVELLYQVSRIASERGRPLSRSEENDSYILFALILLQLFQPELFRVVRRKESSLVSFLGAFLGTPPLWSGHQDVSEVSLWQWAVDYQPDRLGNNSQNISAPYDLTSSISYLSAVPDYVSTDRYYAQQVRLPLVQRLVEHMQVERHAFNPFKWAKELATQLGEERVRNLDIRYYNQYLSQQKEGVYATVNIVLSAKMSAYATTRPNHGVKISFTLLDNIYDRLISKDLGLQSELRTLLEPYQGQVFDEVSTDYLLKRFEDTEVDRISVLRGLTDLAPHIDIQHYGKDFWALVSELGKGCLPDPNRPNKITKDPVQASLYLDVQSMLGQDDRFDRDETKDSNGKTFKPLFLLKNRWNNNDKKQEPIPSFVLIPADTYPVGDPEVASNNPRDSYMLLNDIYIARTPVTVDQFSAFIADGGYGESNEDLKAKNYWDDQGWVWRHTDSFMRDLNGSTNPRKRLNPYFVNLRSQPWNWEEQLRVGSRAVTGITWFEARAYARWLHDQLLQRKLLVGKLAGYAVCLPNEWQWELAARGQRRQRWPWGDNQADSAKRSNIRISSIDHPSVPGCFAPNYIGLLDLTGNVLEYQDGLFTEAKVLQQEKQQSNESQSEVPPLDIQVQTMHDRDYQRLPQNSTHILTSKWGNSNAVAVRGGSWINDSKDAACSTRRGSMADVSGDNLGFRVMLSPKKIDN